MKNRGKRRRADATVSASGLVQMGRREQLVVFEQRHGQHQLPYQEAARRHGMVEHRSFEREGVSAQTFGSLHVGCRFIASLLFGEAWQTQVLRQFRDIVLRPRRWGRPLIRLYHRAAPGLSTVLQR